MKVFALGCVLLTGAVGCSAVDYRYHLRGYDSSQESAVKRIAVVSWAPAEHLDLGPVLSSVATDRIKLVNSYLVHHSGPADRGWLSACGQLEGVLVLRALDVQKEAKNVALRILAGLYDCRDGALLWQVEGSGGSAIANPDLQNLVEQYTAKLGEGAAVYVSATFVVLKELLESIPEPVLSDDEIMEKIELD